MDVQTIPIDELKKDPHNARLHDERNLEAIVKSLKEFGQQKPIVVTTGGKVVAGNGTLAAARVLGWTEIVVVRTKLRGRKAKAYALADNRSAELADWDREELQRQMDDLIAFDPNLADACGFDAEDLAALVGVPDLGSEGGDAEPEPPAPEDVETRTQPGDIWLLGDHVLVCGDSTNEDAVREAMRGEKPVAMITDPPYGVEYSPEWRNEQLGSSSEQTGKVLNDDRASWSAAYRHFPGDVAYIWHAATFSNEVERSLLVSGFELRAQIIWVKNRFALSRGHYHWRHEACWYAVRKGGDARWVGNRKQQTVWADIVDAGKPNGDLYAAEIDEATLYLFEASHSTVWELGHDTPVGGGHSTQKPLEAMARPMRNHGEAGDHVYDPFLGTGTTLLAAEKLKRVCPAYCDVILRRWEEETGQEAQRG